MWDFITRLSTFDMSPDETIMAIDLDLDPREVLISTYSKEEGQQKWEIYQNLARKLEGLQTNRRDDNCPSQKRSSPTRLAFWLKHGCSTTFLIWERQNEIDKTYGRQQSDYDDSIQTVRTLFDAEAVLILSHLLTDLVGCGSVQEILDKVLGGVLVDGTICIPSPELKQHNKIPALMVTYPPNSAKRQPEACS